MTRVEETRLPPEVWVLISANAVIALGYGFVSPVLPQFARHFGVSISAATFVVTAFALMRLCFAPVTGVLVQRLGERRIYVNGLLVVAVSTAALEDYFSQDTLNPVKIAPDHYFVLGDNRRNSSDSRYWGTVARPLVYGKYWYRYWKQAAPTN